MKYTIKNVFIQIQAMLKKTIEINIIFKNNL